MDAAKAAADDARAVRQAHLADKQPGTAGALGPGARIRQHVRLSDGVFRPWEPLGATRHPRAHRGRAHRWIATAPGGPRRTHRLPGSAGGAAADSCGEPCFRPPPHAAVWRGARGVCSAAVYAPAWYAHFPSFQSAETYEPCQPVNPAKITVSLSSANRVQDPETAGILQVDKNTAAWPNSESKIPSHLHLQPTSRARRPAAARGALSTGPPPLRPPLRGTTACAQRG